MSPRCACGKHELPAGATLLLADATHNRGACKDAHGWPMRPPSHSELAEIESKVRAIGGEIPVREPRTDLVLVPSPRLLDATLDQLEAAITRAIIAARPTYSVESISRKSALEALGAWNDSLRGASDRVAGPEVRS